MATLQLVSPPVPRPLSILSPEFLARITAFNDLTRDMRAAEVHIEHLEFLNNSIFIATDSVELVARRFGHELRSSRHRTVGKFTRHAVTIRGVDVVWFSPIKEQDQ